jgi:hypothetical protein
VLFVSFLRRQESRAKATKFSPRRVAEGTRLHGNDDKIIYRSVKDSTLEYCLRFL